ncbi:MAG: hypothetical protein JOY62_10775 [Acidobacteriaceae bacterium]|nr:hypothetical protein [Acidobacteriaceae bacterium]MBV9780443.1 hypothetical protein [Acidobacteriaceae bacterium]
MSKQVSRRACLGVLLLSSGFPVFSQLKDVAPPDDWVCPMDPDYHSAKPGKCPRCGMTLVLHVPDRVEYPLEVSHTPELLRANQTAILNFRVIDPATNRAVERFEIVHEKLMHVFLVSGNLEYFAHEHPVAQKDGSFQLPVVLPLGGMYRMLADFYPAGSVPQLALSTFFVSGPQLPANITESLAPSKGANLIASLRMDPEQPRAGLETKLFYTLDPSEGLEPYLGVWAHMLIVSSDLIDMLHVHPLLKDQSSTIQFNVVFPRSGFYRIWSQFQRKGVVNTTVFTVPVKDLA